MTRERYALLRRNADRMLARSHLRVDELRFLVAWLDECLREVEPHVEPEQLPLDLVA